MGQSSPLLKGERLAVGIHGGLPPDGLYSLPNLDIPLHLPLLNGKVEKRTH